MDPTLEKSVQPVVDGERYRRTHRASVIGILGDKAPPVFSRGSKFYNLDKWTLRIFIAEMCKWAQANPECIPTKDEINSWVVAANNTQAPNRCIVIANTPDKLPLRTALALTGGGYHEALHTYLSCRRYLRTDEMVALVIPRWALVKDWSKYHSALLGWSNIVEDIRIERRGREEFEGTFVPFCDLQDFILNMEAKGEEDLRSHGQKVPSLSVIVRTFRDIGLGYNTDDQVDALAKYRKEHPQAVDLVLKGPITPFLKKAIGLDRTDDTGCLKVTLEVIAKLAELAGESQESEQASSGQAGDGKQKCPQCGAPANAIKVHPKSDGNGRKVKGVGIATCTKCGWQKEVKVETKDNSKSNDPQDDPGSETQEELDDWFKEDDPEEKEGGGSGKGKDSKPGKDKETGKEKDGKGKEKNGKEKEDKGSKEKDWKEGGSEKPGKDKAGGKQPDSEKESDGDASDEGESEGSDSGEDGSEGEGEGSGELEGEGKGKGKGDGAGDEGDGEEGNEGEGEGEGSGEGEGDGSGEGEGEGDGQGEGDGSGEGEGEGDGQGEGQGDGTGGGQDSGQGIQGNEFSGGSDSHAHGAGGHQHNVDPHAGTEWNWTEIAAEAVEHALEDLGIQDVNSAMEENVGDANEKADRDLKNGEAPWKPYDPALDTAELVRPSARGCEYDRTKANELVKSVTSETAYLRARLRTVVRSMEMTSTYHGVPRGKGLSQRFLVDSKAALVGGQFPKKAYYRKGQQIDMTMACAVVLDESGSMYEILQDASRILVALTEPFDALHCPTLALGFRNGNGFSGWASWNRPEDAYADGVPYHRYNGVHYDIFKTWNERFATVKWRFANTQANGGTPMADGIQFALKELSIRDEAHRFLFVVTDGYPDGGHEPIIKRQIRLAKEAGIHIVGVGLGAGAVYVKKLFSDYVWAKNVTEIPALLVAKLNELADVRSGKRGKRIRKD